MARYRLGTIAAVAATAGLTLTGCGGEAASESPSFGSCEVYGEKGSVSIEPVTEDTLTVQTNLPSPGWWKGISPEKIDGGYEYCLAANIAHRAGLSKVEVVNASFDALVAGQTKDFDIAMAQISITPEREEVVEFSQPYFDSNVAILAKKGADITASNITSKKTGVALGTTAVDFVNETIRPETEARVFQDTDTMVTAVSSGQVDAAIQDTAIMLGFTKASSGSLEVVGQYKTGEKYGAIYPKGSPNAEAMDEAIAAMSDDGTLEKLSASWLGPTLGGDPAKVPVFEAP
ncbi:amino acid ABC transporter substrate-binding protein [Arthrobacter crusticola]|uniref:Amino acid ABC transporter substrate-binding protein n=1 Tax=Arthrobacter crusticola TaxID=2547960 RepID=A0A4R5TZC4_9MICC|nr:ABC transporter substrate-binding protein [Arthrobacter crusticola]TDK26596.1 amino acid ABC transporter substrate-binding protein [Arthrobacter crusticola]